MKKAVINLIKFIPRKIKKLSLLFIEKDLKRIRNIEAVQNNLLLLQKLILSRQIDQEFNIFQGEVLQDLYAYLFFNGKKDGFYIDIGANDGKHQSNTYFFEHMGWKGVCIEPQKDIFEILKQNRKCDVYNAAISGESKEEAEFIKAAGAQGLSGLNSQMSKAHKKRIKKENGKIEIIKIKTLSFEDLMKNYPEKLHIDFLSIDVEGAEMSILKGVDFSKYSFGLLTIENNEETEGMGNELIKFMDSKGYRVLHDLGLDIMFIKKSPEN